MKWGFLPKNQHCEFHDIKKTWSRPVDKIGMHIFFISQENEKHELCLNINLMAIHI